MPLYKGLLVSCKRNFEQSAGSEIQYTLVDKLGISSKSLKVSNSGTSGLLTVNIKEEIDPNEIISKLIELERDTAYFFHCLKIKPIQQVTKIPSDGSLDELFTIVTQLANKMDTSSSYKIMVSKRHSKFSTQDILSALAPLISNTVNLDNPDYVLLVEILADKIGVSLTKPELIFSTKLTEVTQQSKDDNWFLSN